MSLNSAAVAGVTSGDFGQMAIAGILTASQALFFEGAGTFLENRGLLGNEAAVFLTHGFVGGVYSEIGGGNFGSGFLAAGLGSLAAPWAAQSGPVGGTVISAAVGGLGSVLGGGKFANGAVTGSFGYLFNYAKHRLSARQRCVLDAGGCSFTLKDAPRDATAAPPWYESDNYSEVQQFNALIDPVAERVGVDPNLIRAIIYMESTHGYYDNLIAWTGQNKSILPMNVNEAYWTGVWSRANLQNPSYNIGAGAIILRGIIANLPHGAPISWVATLYNNLNATHVNSYGLAVEEIYNFKSWE